MLAKLNVNLLIPPFAQSITRFDEEGIQQRKLIVLKTAHLTLRTIRQEHKSIGLFFG